tara:strand:- start:4420 stop:6252 length:1833 start_codon:yes stop_codon:yes gene_type:complete
VPANPGGFSFTSLLMLSTLRNGLLIVGALATFVASGQAQSTPERTRPHALRGVTWVGESTPRTILIQDGRIERIQPADQAIPESYTVLEAEGLVATASFLDAYSHSGSKTAEPVAEQDRPVDVGANVRTDMRPANRKGVQPSFQAAEASALDADASKAWSQSGFGALLSAPHGELLAGTSVLLATRDAARRDQTVRANVFHHGAFQATGPGYPSTLMAYMAQLRQFFMDAQHQAELVARWEAGRPGPRPPHDPELEAALSLMDGTTLLVCEADTARDVHRWIGLADEFGLRIAIAGGRDAWRAADLLAERKIPVVLTLDWGDEVDDPREKDEDEEDETEDEEGAEAPPEEAAEEVPEADDSAKWDYEEPFGVKLDKRLRWEERRDSARVLTEAGVDVYFGSGGDKASDLLERVRTLVEAGMPKDAALLALTSRAADWMGVPRQFGSLEPGAGAHLTLWTGDPFDEDSQVRYSITDGFVQEFDAKTDEAPAQGVDLDGTWRVKDPDSEDSDEMHLTLDMDEDGVVTGTVKLMVDGGGEQAQGEVSGRVRGSDVELKVSFNLEGTDIGVSLEGEWKKDGFTGEATVQFENQLQVSRFEASRIPKQQSNGGSK